VTKKSNDPTEFSWIWQFSGLNELEYGHVAVGAVVVKDETDQTLWALWLGLGYFGAVDDE